jgi:glutamate N-acetyltransferase/amino-acid N-acetyltransferase
VIGEPLPLKPFRDSLPLALTSLDEDGWAEAAHGIMTTDTAPKGASRRTSIHGASVTVTGIAKGAGMIRPDMATMLAFIATDAAVAPERLQRCLTEAVDASFNRITVDGDTSTNDACVLLATGRGDHPPLTAADEAYAALSGAVREVCESLARLIVRDGEGATKFITVEVRGGRSEQECRRAAYTIAQSPLVKTAFFGSDPNWGRILAALGHAGVPDLDIGRVGIHINGMCVVRNGGRARDYTEAQGVAAMQAQDITLSIELNRGRYTSHVWTCDLSYEYVRINTVYRS